MSTTSTENPPNQAQSLTDTNEIPSSFKEKDPKEIDRPQYNYSSEKVLCNGITNRGEQCSFFEKRPGSGYCTKHENKEKAKQFDLEKRLLPSRQVYQNCSIQIKTHLEASFSHPGRFSEYFGKYILACFNAYVTLQGEVPFSDYCEINFIRDSYRFWERLNDKPAYYRSISRQRAIEIYALKLQKDIPGIRIIFNRYPNKPQVHSSEINNLIKWVIESVIDKLILPSGFLLPNLVTNSFLPDNPEDHTSECKLNHY